MHIFIYLFIFHIFILLLRYQENSISPQQTFEFLLKKNISIPIPFISIAFLITILH